MPYIHYNIVKTNNECLGLGQKAPLNTNTSCKYRNIFKPTNYSFSNF